MTSEQEYSTVEISDIGYCFSPFIVRAEASSGINSVRITIWNGETQYDEFLQFNLEKEIRRDISGILKSIFGYKYMLQELYSGIQENSSKQMTIAFVVSTNNGEDTHSFQDVTIIYGAVDYFNTYYYQNVNKKIKHFVNFPFGIDFLLSPGGAVFENTGSPYRYNGENDNLVFVLFQKESNVREYSILVSNSISVNTILYPIIYTEYLSRFSKIYTITVDNCKEGVYLMWLDRQGMRRFFLFKNKGITTNVEGDEYTHTLSYNVTYLENNLQINKKIKRSIKLAAAKADREEYEYIEDVIFSPEVYMYDENVKKFIRVNVEEGDFERTTAELQDFQFNILLPEEYTSKI